VTSEARRPFVVRHLFLIVGSVALAVGYLSVVAVVAPGLSQPACGCTSPASVGPPTPTPPVALSKAAASAAKVTGVAMTPSVDWLPMGDRKVVDATGPNARAIVDGFSGQVLLAVRADLLPAASSASVSPQAAEAAALSFLDAAGLEGGGLTATTSTLQTAPAVYEVDLARSSTATYRVYVNGVSGKVFAFTDAAFDYSSVPVISKDEAVRRARQALPEEGDVVLDATLDLTTFDKPVWTWQIGLGIPLPSDVYTGGGYVEVDASTGLASVMKDARDGAVAKP